MKRIFLHNPHDRASREALDSLLQAGVAVDEVLDITGVDRQRLTKFQPRSAPAYVVLDSNGEVVYSVEETSVDAGTLSALDLHEFETRHGQDVEVEIQQRITDVEEALALLHMQLVEALQR
jgi:hypothetical protein